MRSLLATLLVALVLIGTAPRSRPVPSRPEEPIATLGEAELDGVLVLPEWQVGDRWVVETRSRASTTGHTTETAGAPWTVRWSFEVARQRIEAGEVRLEIRIQPQLEGPNVPTTSLWVSRETGMIRRFETQVPTATGLRRMVESYSAAAGGISPVLGPLSVLPLDLPGFGRQAAKSDAAFAYEAVPGADGAKDADSLGFLYVVHQQVSPASDELVSGIEVPFGKGGAGDPPLHDVRLDTTGRSVRQLWGDALPWPVWSDDGRTTARMVDFTPAPR